MQHKAWGNFLLYAWLLHRGGLHGWHLDTKMAQDIVARTVHIIDTNINVMDARSWILGLLAAVIGGVGGHDLHGVR